MITFNANGGYWKSSNNTNTEVKKVNTNKKCVLNQIVDNPERPSHYLIGWATSLEKAKNKEVDYETNATYTGNSISLWAV